MREAFRDDLDDISATVVTMIHQVRLAMDRATAALLDGDLALADSVVAADIEIDTLRTDLDDRCVALIAQQQPVATDLRVLISTIHLAGQLERMGDLAAHIARIARLRHPDSAVPGPARGVIAQMGQLAVELAGALVRIVRDRDVESARQLRLRDDVMDELRRTLFTIVLSPEWSYGTAAAVDVTLLGRYYERFADHVVTSARHTEFVATGVRPLR